MDSRYRWPPSIYVTALIADKLPSLTIAGFALKTSSLAEPGSAGSSLSLLSCAVIDMQHPHIQSADFSVEYVHLCVNLILRATESVQVHRVAYA